MTVYASRIPTPVGEMYGAVDENGAVVLLEFSTYKSAEEAVSGLDDVVWDDKPVRELTRQVKEYFAGRRREFDLDLSPRGSDFQHRVWKHVRGIGYGSTASYGDVARRMRKRGASRAVGRANATNPVCLITPCHRVIGADGSLTGFGGGVEIKRWLLEHETGQLALAD